MTPSRQKTKASSSTSRDADLVTAVVQKIVAAQRKGTLSNSLHMDISRSHCIVSNLEEGDVAWFLRNYPQTSSARVGVAPRRGKAKARFDRIEYRVDLRERDGRYDYPPVLYYQGLTEHTHQLFRGDFTMAMDYPHWRCVECGSALNKTEMRALGLLAPPVRKTNS